MNTYYVVRSSCPAGFGLERLATAFMNNPGWQDAESLRPHLFCADPNDHRGDLFDPDCRIKELHSAQFGDDDCQ